MQNKPFTLQTAKFEIEEIRNKMMAGIECLLCHKYVPRRFWIINTTMLTRYRHVKTALVLVPPRNFTAWKVRQYFSLQPPGDFDDIIRSGVKTLDAKSITTLLNNQPEKARKQDADLAETQRRGETCDLLLDYHNNDGEKSGAWLGVPRFTRLTLEALDRLGPVCAEYCSLATFQRVADKLVKNRNSGLEKLGKKRKVVEIEEEKGRKKGRMVMKNGKLVAVYD